MFASFAFGEAEFVDFLKVEPEFGGGIEEVCESECGVACDGASMVEYLGDAVGGNSDVSGEFGGAHAKFVQLTPQDAPPGGLRVWWSWWFS